jgi:nuclear pore complex protein Nup160
MMQWLASNVPGNVPATGEERAERKPLESSSDMDRPARGRTIFETLFAVDLRPQSSEDQNQAQCLTNDVCDLLAWTTGGNSASISLDEILVHIQCYLLKNNYIDLASSFLQFQPSTAWAIYVRGRLCLLRDEYAEAAIYFKKAAFKICKGWFCIYKSWRMADRLQLGPIPRHRSTPKRPNPSSIP